MGRAQMAAPHLVKLKTFIIEDNPLIRQGLIDALEESSCLSVVGFSATEGQALGWIESNPGLCDVAVIDLSLEEGTGLGVLAGLELMKSQGKPVPQKVVFSNMSGADLRATCMRLGADAMFDKSYEVDELILWLCEREMALNGSKVA
jgi:two-component system OmpR family response regulator